MPSRLLVRCGPVVLLEDPGLALFPGSFGAIARGGGSLLVHLRAIDGPSSLATARARGAIELAGQRLAVTGLGADEQISLVVEPVGCVPLRLLWQRVRDRALTVDPAIALPLLLDSLELARRGAALGVDSLSLDDAAVGLGRIVLPPAKLPATFIDAIDAPPWDAQALVPDGVTRLPAMTVAARAAFALLTGREPVGVASTGAEAERLAVTPTPPIPLGDLRPDVPAPLAALIDALRSPVDSERPDHDAVVAALAAIGDVDAARPGIAALLEAACAEELRAWTLVSRELAATPWERLAEAVKAMTGWRALSLLPPSSTGAWTDQTEEYRRPAPPVERWPHDDRDMARVAPRLRMDTAPVSRAAFARFAAATGRRPPWGDRTLGDEELAAPVVDLAIDEARAYARFMKKRLPLQTEWQEGIALLGLSSAGGGRVWEWTASRFEHGHVVRGGPLRDSPEVPGVLSNRRWDVGAHPDIGFRCVADG